LNLGVSPYLQWWLEVKAPIQHTLRRTPVGTRIKPAEPSESTPSLTR
jgi:hypothetical protein